MHKLNKQNRNRFTVREEAESSGSGVRGWKDGEKKKKDLWTWTTVW